jgi:teichuronic acid biosynthesis glycosyltransferase TuaH
MKNRHIVIVSLQSWHSNIGSNCINIAKEFSKENKVLYVNRAADRNSIIKKIIKQKTDTEISESSLYRYSLENPINNLWVLNTGVVLESINWLPNPFFDYFNKQNGNKFANSIKNAINKLGFDDIVLFVDNDFIRAQYLPDLLGVNCFIYYIRDHLVTQPYFKRHGARLESRISKRADFVVANSSYLSSYGFKFNAKSFDIGQGCDFTYFNPAISYEMPDDLKTLSGPIIGYVGALVSFRLDIKLLEKLVLKRKDWNWVFVGPEDEDFMASSLHKFPNVFFLGRKNEKELASYVSYFDVCINPQLVNEITIGNYPRKVDEYLAMGKPVVATYTEFMKGFLPWVHLCNKWEEYELAIEESVAEKNNIELKEKRQAFALTHTWESSVKKIYNIYKNEIEGNE